MGFIFRLLRIIRDELILLVTNIILLSYNFLLLLKFGTNVDSDDKKH